jgi:hypothetical protein
LPLLRPYFWVLYFNNSFLKSLFSSPDPKSPLQKDEFVNGNTINGGLIALFLDRNVTCANNTLNSPNAQGIFLSLPSYDVTIKNNIILNSISTAITVKLQTDHKDENNEPLLDDSYRSSGILIVGNKIENARNHGIAVNNLTYSVIKDNVVNSTDFNGIYLLQSDHLLVTKNQVTNAALVLAEAKETLYPGWRTAWDSGIYVDAFVSDSIISLNTINSTNDLMQWGIAVNHGVENNNSENNVYWNHFSGLFKHQKVHVAPNTNNYQFNNDIAERTGNGIWLQIIGDGTVMVDGVVYNKSTYIEFNEIGTHIIKAIADEGSQFITWEEDIECREFVCSIDNTTLLDVIVIFRKAKE